MLTETKFYRVGDHVFSVTADEDTFQQMKNYEPFLLTEGGATGEEVRFALTVGKGEAVALTEEMRQEDEGQIIVCGHTEEGCPVYEFHWWGQTAGWLVCTDDYRRARLVLSGCLNKLAVDNGLMVLYALSTAGKGTALFHAATVSHAGKAYAFLGHSGTGKSTHASLCLRYVEDTQLVNDDNPVVRIWADGQATIYGSPWSGKTPCYRNVSYPLGGFVNLSQAPYNRIRPLRGIQAYAALVPSISGKRWDRRIADGLHLTENALAEHVAVWHLECLPDEEAARVCHAAVTGNGK